MDENSPGELWVIGGGLAGCEAAWQASQRNVLVTLFEMRPQLSTPAHQTQNLAELVCSNSLGSDLADRAPGLLKAELRRLESLIVSAADGTAVPAGGALAVDRETFSQLITRRLEDNPAITVRREEVTSIPRDAPCIVATGPLTSPALSDSINDLLGNDNLYFYDAMAPIVSRDSIDFSKAFRASRYGRGDDYLNCPLNRQEYERFVRELLAAETAPLRDFEREDERFFEACLPVEVLARRGMDSLAYGPMKPVGLTDPSTGCRPYAVVQLRQDNLAGTLYNMVGFQTNLRWKEQERVLRLIPGLERAEFIRFGQMHRNTFINAPLALHATMQYRQLHTLFFGGQLTGTEGYVASTGSGLVAGLNAARLIQGRELLRFPPTTMLGALCEYVSSASPSNFQPMKPNFGLLPPLEKRVRRKRDRNRAYAERSLADLEAFLHGIRAS